MYLLNHLSDEYAQRYSQEETILNQIDEVLLCKSLIETCETPHLSWYIDDGDKCCDFPFMYGFIPIVNQRAYKVIKDLSLLTKWSFYLYLLKMNNITF